MPRFLRSYFRMYRDALQGLPRATWILGIITFVHRAGTMVTPFLALYFARELQLGDAVAGWLLSLFGFGGAVGAYAGGWLSDRLGAARMLGLAMIAIGVSFHTIPAIETQAALEIAMPLFGVIAFSFRPAAITAVARTCAPDQRAQAFAFQRLAINLGMGIGPALGGALATVDYGLLFRVDGTVCALVGVVILALRRAIDVAPPEPAPSPDDDTAVAHPPEDRSPFRDGMFLLIAANTFVLACVGMQWLSTGPLYLKDSYGMDELAIGRVLAFNPVLIVLFEVVLVQAIKEHRPLPWISCAGGLLAISCVLMPFGAGEAWAYLVVAVWTVAEMIESPLSGAFTATRAGTKRLGQYMGLYAFAFSLAIGLAPGAGMWIYETYGPNVLWFGAATLAGCSALAVAAIARRAGTVKEPRSTS